MYNYFYTNTSIQKVSTLKLSAGSILYVWFKQSLFLSVLFYSLVDTNDFNSSLISVVFEADEGEQVTYTRTVNISITDDDINEATDQYFVVTMDIAKAENRSMIMTTRESSLCVIFDNDRKLILIQFHHPHK